MSVKQYLQDKLSGSAGSLHVEVCKVDLRAVLNHVIDLEHDVARYRMMGRLVAEQEADEEGPLSVAAEAITDQLDAEFGGDVPPSKGLPRLLDALIARFPETK